MLDPSTNGVPSGDFSNWLNPASPLIPPEEISELVIELIGEMMEDLGSDPFFSSQVDAALQDEVLTLAEKTSLLESAFDSLFHNDIQRMYDYIENFLEVYPFSSGSPSNETIGIGGGAFFG